MKFVVAMIRHETNTFSPIPTRLEDFRCGTTGAGPAYGDDALAACRKMKCASSAFIDIATAQGHEVVMSILAYAVPSGIVADHAFESICATVMSSVGAGCDAILLDLHGAMVTESYDDPEGELVARIRAIAPALPVAAALDFHANLSDRFLALATVVAGYQTYPHVDMYETGERAARTLLDSLHGLIQPCIVWRALPMMTHMLRQSPSNQPMKDIVDLASQAEHDKVILNATVFGGFPLADVPYVGLTIVIVYDAAGADEANTLLNALASMAWSRRAQFVFAAEPVEHSLRQARALKDGPVLLVDHGDNAGAGGPTDVMEVLRLAMAYQLDNVVAGPFRDPDAVAKMFAAGEGARLEIALGGGTDMPAIGLKGKALTLVGKVARLTDGAYTVTGPMYTGMKMTLGRTAVFSVGNFVLVVCERPQEPFDTGVFTHAGIDLNDARYILIKSRQHFRAGFEPIARHIVLVAGPGVCSSDYRQFPYRKLRRPIYPLDDDASFDPDA